MTALQLQHANLVETARANTAKEALTATDLKERARANLASEGLRAEELSLKDKWETDRIAETVRANKAKEALDSQRVDISQQAEDRAQDRHELDKDMLEANIEGQQLQNVSRRVNELDDLYAWQQQQVDSAKDTIGADPLRQRPLKVVGNTLLSALSRAVKIISPFAKVSLSGKLN